MLHPYDNQGNRAVRDRAYALAESGRYSAVSDVERALIGEGWPNAGQIIRSDYVMRAVEEKCREAHAKQH